MFRVVDWIYLTIASSILWLCGNNYIPGAAPKSLIIADVVLLAPTLDIVDFIFNIEVEDIQGI